MKKLIKTVEDVRRFAKQLVEEKVSFHPDDDFADYVNFNTDEPTYSREEAETRNKLMEECFEVCQRNGVDVYEIMNIVIVEYKRPPLNQKMNKAQVIDAMKNGAILRKNFGVYSYWDLTFPDGTRHYNIRKNATNFTSDRTMKNIIAILRDNKGYSLKMI